MRPPSSLDAKYSISFLTSVALIESTKFNLGSLVDSLVVSLIVSEVPLLESEIEEDGLTCLLHPEVIRRSNIS